MEFNTRKAALLNALIADPHDADALKALGDLHKPEGRWAELAESLQELESRVAAEQARANFAFLAGRVWEAQAREPGRAIDCYLKALQHDPGHLDALDRLRVLLTAQEDWPAVIKVLEQEARLATDPMEEADVQFELGILWEQKLEQWNEALQAYQRAFRLDPGMTRALTAARNLFARQGQWSMVAQLLRLEADAAGIELNAQVAALRELGRVLFEHGHDRQGAKKVLEEALDADPDNEAVFQALAALEEAATPAGPPSFAAPAKGRAVWETVPVATPEPIAPPPQAPPSGAEEESPDKRAGSKKGKKGEEPARPESGKGAKAAKSTKGKKGRGRKGDDKETPENGDVEESATRTPVVAEAGAPQTPASPPRDEDDARSSTMPVMNGDSATSPIESTAQPAAPVATPSVATPVEPVAPPAPEPLPVHTEPEPTAAQEAQPAAEPPPVLIGLQPDGRILSPQAQGGMPVTEYQELLTAAAARNGDTSEAAHDLREILLAREGNWRDLQTALRQRWGSETEGRIAQSRSLAVLAEWVGSPDKSVDAWRQVLQGNPADLQAKDALKRIHRLTGKWNAVVELLKKEAEELPEEQASLKISILKEMIAIYRDQLHSDTHVTATYQALLKTDPTNQEAIDALAEQFEKIKRWPDLVGVLQKKVELLREPAEKIALYKRLASLFAERFSNHTEAIKCHEAVLELAPADAEAIAFLKEMYEKRRDWDKLIDVHEREAALLVDPDARADAISKVARQAMEKLKRSNRPTELWEKVLTLRGEDAAALDALEQIHDAAKDWGNLARILRKKVELESQPQKEAELWEKLGRLYGERLRDSEAAVNAWQRVLALVPDHARARDALKRSYIEASDWDQLTTHYAERDDWKELVRILESQVGVIQDDGVKVELLFRSAAIYEERLAQPDRSIRALERIISIDEQNLKASLRLIPVYEEKRDWKRLVRCHEVRLTFTTERETRREILTTLAGLCQEKVNEPLAAFRWLLLAVKENPADSGLRADLERLGQQLMTWEEVVAQYRDNRTALQDQPEALLALELQLGRALAEELSETTEAMEAYHRALQIDPTSRTALYALETLYKRTGRWEDLLDNLARSFALCGDPAERRRLLVEIALVEEEQLGEPVRAVTTYLKVIEEAPNDLEVLQNLHRLLRSQERWKELATILERELTEVTSAGAPEAEVAALRLELGRVLHHQLARTVDAITSFREVLGLIPDHAEAIAELEGLLEQPDLLPLLFTILDPAYEGGNQWPKLVGLLERRQATLEDPAERLDMLLRRADLQERQLGDGPAAFETYSRAMQLDPEDERPRTQLESLAERLEFWGQLVALYREITSRTLPLELTSSLFLMMARVEDEKLGHPGPAEEAYRSVLELEPESQPALQALEQLYTRAENWERLLDIYQRQRDLAPDAAAREALSFRIGYLWEELLGNLVEATETYRRILDQSPTNDQALEALDRLYSTRKMWPELADNLRRRIELAQGRDELALTLRLAALLETELGEGREAIELYRSVLERRPGDPDATIALERLMADPEHRLPIALILEPHYQEGGAWEKLIGVLEIQLGATEESFGRLQLIHRIARLQETKLQLAEDAFRTYGRALAEQPADEQTREELHRLADLLGNYSDLVQLYEEEVRRLADTELTAHFLKTCAHLYEERLEDVRGALVCWRKVLELQPENLDVMNALIRLLHGTEKWAELVEMLRFKKEAVGDPEQQIMLLGQAALIYEEMLSDRSSAIRTYEEILGLDDRNHEALDALMRLHTVEQAWPQLLEVLERKVQLAEAGSVKLELLGAAGHLLEDKLHDPTQAIQTYRRVLELDPLHEQTLLALDRLLGEAADWVGQLEVLDRRVEIASRPEERIELQFRVARLWDTRLDDPLRAIEGYREILAEVPEHPGARESLTALVRAGRDPEAAADVLLPLYRSRREWPLVVELIELWLPHVPDQFQRIRLLEDAARVREELQDASAAFETLARAFREQPTREESLELLEQLSERSGSWERYVALLESELGQDPAQVSQLLLRSARVLEEELGALPEAIERFHRVLEVSSQETTAIEALDRLYQRLGRWSELAGLLELKISLANTIPQRQGLMMRLATLRETVLEAIPAAITLYQEILLEEPAHTEAIASLERLFQGGHEPLVIVGILTPLYEDAQTWTKLISLKEASLPYLATQADRISTIKDTALLALEKLGDPDLALSWYGRAFVLATEQEEVAAELERLARLTASWEELVHIYLEAQEQTQATQARCQVLLKVARVYEEELLDRAQAEKCYESVLTLDENERTALTALDRLYQLDARWADLVTILEREIVLEEDEVAVVGLVYRLARLHEHQLGDLDLAVERYRNILDADPMHEGALKALESIYVQREEWEPLFDIYQRQADLADAGAGKAQIYAKMANLASEMLARPSDAITMWNQVTGLLGDDLEALRALAVLHEQQHQWRELVEVLERQTRVVGDSAEEVRLLARQGVILEEQLHDDPAARICWEQVLALDPQNVSALQALRLLYRKMQCWEELVETLQRLLELHLGTGEEQAARWAELGRLEADTLQRPEPAILAWRQVLALQPEELEAVIQLERLYEAQEDWISCAEILELKADRLSDRDVKVETLLRVAQICLERTLERERAVAFLQGVQELDPANHQASTTLERVFEEDGDAARLLDLLLLRLDHTTDPETRLALLLRCATICEERLDNSTNAFWCMTRAFSEVPTDPRVAAELERLAQASSQWEQLLDLYEEMIPRAEPDLQLELQRRRGRVYAEELHAPDEAIAAYQQVLRANRNDPIALAALERLFRKASRWAELVAVLKLQVEAEQEPELLATHYNQMGEILEEQVRNTEKAVEAFRQVLKHREDDETALVALERIFLREGRWRELIDILSRRATATLEADRVIAFKAHIGEIWETKLQVGDRAIEAYREILRLDPCNTDACRALERLYTAQDKWKELIEIYGIWLAAVDDPYEKCELLAKTAAIHEEEFHDAPAAVEAFNQILEIQPDHLNAIRALERLNRELKRWQPLIDVYRRHFDVAQRDREVSVGLLLAIGGVYAEQLNDRDQAIDSYRSILDFDPQHKEALQALAKLYEEAADHDATVTMLQRLRNVCKERTERVELGYKTGQLYLKELEDPGKAEDFFYQVLDEDPNHLPSIEALRDMAYERQEWRSAVILLKRQEEATRELVEKARVLLAIGKIYQDRENDPLSASTYFERCIELDPENVEAATPLVEMYLHERRWERAEPLLDLLVRRLGRSRHTEGIHLVHYQAGLVAENLFKDDKALRHYRSAFELDATHLPTLEGLGRLLYKREDWDRAFKIYQTILVHHREKQTSAQQVEIFYRLAIIKLKVGERPRGRQLFEKALELDPHHRPTLEALVDLHEKQGDWEKVIECKRAMLATMAEEEQKRFDLLVDIANIWREKLRNVAKSIEAYNEALQIDPHSRQVMHHLLNLYTQEKEWPYAVQILLRTIQLEERPDKVARYCYTAGVIYRDELKDEDKAVELFNQALDADQGFLKAFEAIDRIQTRNKQWPQLERNYRKMIKRVTDSGIGGEDLQVLLWKNLGEIYRTRMGKLEEAATAFSMASRLRPNDLQLHEIIAELYERMPEAKEKAIAVHRRMLELEKFRYSSYHAMYRLYHALAQFDRAWCVAAALSVARQATPEEEDFYKKYRGPTIKYTNRPIEREMWTNYLYHPTENLHIGGIFAVLAPYNPFPTQTLKDWDIKKRDLHDRSKPLLFNKVFNSTLQALNMVSQAPAVYLKREQHTGMKNAYLEPWSLIIGPDMLQGRPDRELAFMLGKTLTFFRPEHYLANVLPITHLKILFFAAVKLTQPESNIPVPAEAESFNEILRLMQKSIPPPILVDLHKRVSVVLRSRMEIDLGKWIDGVDATSNRVGLLLSGDLETATDLIRSEQGSIGRATAQERAEDLYMWSISEEYFALRKALGLIIG